MSINSYSGLQGSGKSYEVVSSIIVHAVRAGRRVVTNIRGIDSDAVRAYCCEMFDVPLDQLGEVISVSDDVVAAKDFFPTEHSYGGAGPASLVRPGDLVAVDEAYKIWGTDCKIHNEHKVFFREHRHYAHPDTGVTCDLVLMTQDISDLHRVLKVVIEQSFRTHKAKGVGLNSVYTITMWEGWKQTTKGIVKDWTRTYNPQIFALYKSYAGDQQGKETATDSRQNIFRDRKFIYKIGVFVCVLAFIVYRLFHWWWDKTHPHQQVNSDVVAVGAPAGPLKQVGASGSLTIPTYSSEWRIAGVIVVSGRRHVLLSSGGRIRLDDTVGYIGEGFTESGVVDGSRVTRFSGQPLAVPSSSALGFKP